MERMVEQVRDSDYKRYIHFLSVSKWSHEAVNTATLKDAISQGVEFDFVAGDGLYGHNAGLKRDEYP